MKQPVTFVATTPIDILDPDMLATGDLIQYVTAEPTAEVVVTEFNVEDLKRTFGTRYKRTSPFLVGDGTGQLFLVEPRPSDAMSTESAVICTMMEIPTHGVSRNYPWGVTVSALYEKLFDIYSELEAVLRAVVMLPPEVFDESVAKNFSQFATVKGYTEEIVMTEVFIDEPYFKVLEMPEVKEKEVGVQLKDVPMNTRANRRLIREVLGHNEPALRIQWEKNPHGYTYDEWLEKIQCIHIRALKDLETIDMLSDDKYVEALHGFQRAEAILLHADAVKKDPTTEPLYNWVKKHYGEELTELGKAAALADIEGVMRPNEGVAGGGGGDVASLFVVGFDGTVVQDMSDEGIIGPVSPFAIATMIALQENGHCVILWHDRGDAGDEAYEDMMEMLASNNFVPNGTVKMVGVSKIRHDDVHIHFPHAEFPFDLMNQFQDVTYTIDVRSFGGEVINIMGAADNIPTLYWGDICTKMEGMGYLTDDQLQEILQSVADILAEGNLEVETDTPGA